MKSKQIVFILVIAIVIVSILIVFKTVERIKEDYGKEKEQVGNDKGRNEQELPQLKPTSESAGEAESSQGAGSGAGKGGDGEGGGAGGGTGSSELPDENRTLPSDINTKPCSFYFLEYGVCAGTCPSGTCQHIGKSCYCILS